MCALAAIVAADGGDGGRAPGVHAANVEDESFPPLVAVPRDVGSGVILPPRIALICTCCCASCARNVKMVAAALSPALPDTSLCVYGPLPSLLCSVRSRAATCSPASATDRSAAWAWNRSNVLLSSIIASSIRSVACESLKEEWRIVNGKPGHAVRMKVFPHG